MPWVSVETGLGRRIELASQRVTSLLARGSSQLVYCAGLERMRAREIGLP